MSSFLSGVMLHVLTQLEPAGQHHSSPSQGTGYSQVCSCREKRLPRWSCVEKRREIEILAFPKASSVEPLREGLKSTPSDRLCETAITPSKPTTIVNKRKSIRRVII